jgi:hypothetical protein
MNAGAAEVRGSLLCFHHADSGLRPEHVNTLEKTARNDAILGGAFHRRFGDRRASIVLWEGLIRRLNSFAGPLFGDQSIFVRASVFERLGGFADIPLMEDIEFSRRLRRLGGAVLLDPPLWSSPRRFRHLGNCFGKRSALSRNYCGVACESSRRIWKVTCLSIKRNLGQQNNRNPKLTNKIIRILDIIRTRANRNGRLRGGTLFRSN